jgi:sterol desaturase/sphingolipid hydroxylase (fatty acid hydroxylase superfamily)
MWQAMVSYANYLWYEISHPEWGNYFYGLVLLSVLVYALELTFPWRKKQKALRKDFWLDLFYVVFNFFLFNLLIAEPISAILSTAIDGVKNAIGLSSLAVLSITRINPWLQMLFLFLYVDFIHWNLHRLLHRFGWLWNFHKVHHSVKEMGFAAHLRYHWFENVYYKSLQYIPLALVGVSVESLFVVHMFTILIGHLNHANLGWGYGIFGKVFNSPKMHIWHHAKELPNQYGVNFGLSLSVWDYLFNTAYIPASGKDIELGFTGDKHFPEGFVGQAVYPLNKKENE